MNCTYSELECYFRIVFTEREENGMYSNFGKLLRLYFTFGEYFLVSGGSLFKQQLWSAEKDEHCFTLEELVFGIFTWKWTGNSKLGMLALSRTVQMKASLGFHCRIVDASMNNLVFGT